MVLHWLLIDLFIWDLFYLIRTAVLFPIFSKSELCAVTSHRFWLVVLFSQVWVIRHLLNGPVGALMCSWTFILFFSLRNHTISLGKPVRFWLLLWRDDLFYFFLFHNGHEFDLITNSDFLRLLLRRTVTGCTHGLCLVIFSVVIQTGHAYVVISIT